MTGRSASRRMILAAALAVPALTAVRSAPTPQRVSLAIGAGPIAGAYIAVASGIASAINDPALIGQCNTGEACGVAGLFASVRISQGSVDNVAGLRTGEIETALCQADVAVAAMAGTGAFAGRDPAGTLRQLGRLFVEHVHVAVDPRIGIRSVRDLRGRRVVLGEPGSGTYLHAVAIMAAYDISEADIIPLYTAPRQGLARLATGQAEAVFFTAAAPNEGMASLAAMGRLALLGVDADRVGPLVAANRSLMPIVIPAAVYGLAEPVATLGVGTLWLTTSDLDTMLARSIVAALWSARGQMLVRAAHPVAATMHPTRAISRSIPLHDGATAFYRDLGLLP